MAADSETANRLRTEFRSVHDAISKDSANEVTDPLGQDGTVTVQLRSFKATGGGEVIFLKGSAEGDKRWTRFRAWGPNGTDYIEKSSYLKGAGGASEFHKRRLEPGDNVVVFDQPEADDAGWIQGLG
jgi:hypothetical protein